MNVKTTWLYEAISYKYKYLEVKCKEPSKLWLSGVEAGRMEHKFCVSAVFFLSSKTG